MKGKVHRFDLWATGCNVLGAMANWVSKLRIQYDGARVRLRTGGSHQVAELRNRQV